MNIGRKSGSGKLIEHYDKLVLVYARSAAVEPLNYWIQQVCWNFVTSIIQSKPARKSTKYLSEPLMYLDGDTTFSDAISWTTKKCSTISVFLFSSIPPFGNNQGGEFATLMMSSEFWRKIWMPKRNLEMMKKLKLTIIYWLLKSFF